MTKREDKLWDERFVGIMKTLAPGTCLRDGLDNILRAKMGALVIIAENEDMMKIVDGGFMLSCDYTPAGLYELAKMDGALVLSADAKKILYANAQLIPDSSILTKETGTRHRTAERAAKQTGGVAVAISQRRNIITLYTGSIKYTLRDIPFILNRANQALQTLEKYKNILSRDLITLSALEFEELVTLNDVAAILARAEYVRRIAEEVRHNVVELGSDGRLVRMQMEELMLDELEMRLLIRDYCCDIEDKAYKAAQDQLAKLDEDNLAPFEICRILGYNVTLNNFTDITVVPRGYRILHKIPRLPFGIINNVVARFQTLHRIYKTTVEELDEVDGVGEARANTIRDGLKRVREQVLLDRHF